MIVIFLDQTMRMYGNLEWFSWTERTLFGLVSYNDPWNTLQEYQGTFKDNYPFPMVGYVIVPWRVAE